MPLKLTRKTNLPCFRKFWPYFSRNWTSGYCSGYSNLLKRHLKNVSLNMDIITYTHIRCFLNICDITFDVINMKHCKQRKKTKIFRQMYVRTYTHSSIVLLSESLLMEQKPKNCFICLMYLTLTQKYGRNVLEMREKMFVLGDDNK